MFLHIKASYFGHQDVVEMLLQHNADSNIQDDEGKTPLFLGIFKLMFKYNGGEIL